MLFAHAGWCQACVARDLLFARAIGSGRIFFVCAACTAAGVERPTADLPPWEQSIKDRSQALAPMGWTLAFASEVGSDQVENEVDESYEDVIAWYPGFQYRSGGSVEPAAAPDRGGIT
jgi:hypothetical protein